MCSQTWPTVPLAVGHPRHHATAGTLLVFLPPLALNTLLPAAITAVRTVMMVVFVGHGSEVPAGPACRPGRSPRAPRRPVGPRAPLEPEPGREPPLGPVTMPVVVGVRPPLAIHMFVRMLMPRPVPRSAPRGILPPAGPRPKVPRRPRVPGSFLKTFVATAFSAGETAGLACFRMGVLIVSFHGLTCLSLW